MLIELLHFNSKKIKKEILSICDWDESSKLKLKQSQRILDLETWYNWYRGYFIWFFGSMSNVEDSFGRKWDTLWVSPWGRKVTWGKTILGGGSEPRRHHGITPLDKYHCNFLVPQSWLKFSRILLWINIISSHSVWH